MKQVIATLMVLALTSILAPVSVQAAGQSAPLAGLGADVIRVTQKDTDGNGRPNITVIDAVFVTPHDRITVYDGGSDMRATDQWQQATDFSDDTWVYDIGATGAATLIVQFRVENGHHVAYLWDDTNSDGKVSYKVVNGEPHVTESPFPTMRVEADGDWLLPDGSLNPNVTWTLDGCGDCTMLPNTVRSMLAPQFRHDGQPDFVGGTADQDRDGIPDYLYSTMQTSVSASYGIPRSLVRANESGRAPSPPSGYAFWPLLAGPRTPSAQQYWDQSPYIPFNWRAGIVVGPMTLSGYPIESGFSINTLTPWKPDRVNEAAFENMMAYYDLAADHDGIPELHIRVDYTPAHETFSSDPSSRALEGIRYSWNQKNLPGLSWDYKVGLMGLYQIDTQQQYGPYRVHVVPYPDLPGWVVGKSWGLRSFVAREGPGYLSSEGIYDWGGVIGAPETNYLNGNSAATPDNQWTTITAGYRGEVADSGSTQPWLYFSSVDGRLHMLGVQRGLYNVDGTRTVRYGSLAGDGHVDSWQAYNGQVLSAQLLQVPGQLVYAADGSVSVLESNEPEETFRTLPPTNHDEWVKLGQQLNAHKVSFAADNLDAMFHQFSGHTLTIAGASMADFRLTSAGYRFELDLQPGFNLGDFPLNGVAGSGGYAVSYDRATGTWSAVPLTAATPIIKAVQVSPRSAALSPVNVSVELANDGRQDLTTVPALVTAEQPGTRPTLVKQQVVDLFGDSSVNVGALWQPPGAGPWTITATLYLPGGKTVTRSARIDEVPASSPPWWSVITAGAPGSNPFLYIGLLGGLIGSGAASVLVLARRR